MSHDTFRFRQVLREGGFLAAKVFSGRVSTHQHPALERWDSLGRAAEAGVEAVVSLGPEDVDSCEPRGARGGSWLL